MEDSNKKEPKTPLSDSLNMNPLEKVNSHDLLETFPKTESKEEGEETLNTIYDADYDFSRKSIQDTILKMEDALQELGNIAQQTSEARAYEVFAELAKTILDGNKDLLELSKRHKDLKQNEIKTENNTTNNNLILTSDALSKILEGSGINTGLRTIEEK